MSRGDDAHVGADRRAAANGGVLALLQHPQQAGLRLQRHVADLVEDQRAAGGLLEAAGGAHGGAGDGALLVAEQLAFDELARDRVVGRASSRERVVQYVKVSVVAVPFNKNISKHKHVIPYQYLYNIT